MPKALREWGNGEGSGFLLPRSLRDLGEHRKLPNGPERSLAEIEFSFCNIWMRKKPSGGMFSLNFVPLFCSGFTARLTIISERGKITDTWHADLKMICNDFLVVKVNCCSYVFNIMKYTWILRYVKNKNIVAKKRLKVCTDDLFTFRKWWRHIRKTQPNSLLSVECWQPIAQQHIVMRINVGIGS